MAEERAQRRLTTILAADVVGYSRLMEQNEAGTMALLRARRQDVLMPSVTQHGGRVFKFMGDGVLIEFTSVVNAVECAVDIQKAMQAKNADTPTPQRILLRIGINLGDVIVEGGDLYGDGVNLAARLEALAEPGGICISGDVYRNVRSKLRFDFQDMGDQKVKNIAEPVHAYRVKTDIVEPGTAGTLGANRSAEARPVKPSIAVLPFANMSGDPDQEHFSDGISEDLITEISKFRSLFVISRNSSFSFKGQSINLKELSAKLRVRYIVEGSVRRAGSRLRITAQLIDAVDDAHLWAERYDRRLEDIFDLQDEVVRAIVTAIEPQLLSSERNRVLRKPPESLDAWESYQLGLWYMFRYKSEERDITLSYFERAIELDPRFASAYAGLAYALYSNILLGASPDRGADLERSLKASKTAVGLDDHDPFAYVALARSYMLMAQHEAAMAASDKAIILNPSYAMAHFGRGHSLWHAGRAREAIASHDEAIRLSPHDPILWSYMASKAIALVLAGELDEAVVWSRRAQQQSSAAIFAHVGEICALGLMGRSEEAADAVERAKKTMPDVTIRHLDKVLPISHAPSREMFLKGLRQAGLSE
jgi:adenylate cyclase